MDDHLGGMDYNTEGKGERPLQVQRKPSMKLWTDFYIFEIIPKGQRTPGKVGWLRSVQQGK
jgi:hypothetical protein